MRTKTTALLLTAMIGLAAMPAVSWAQDAAVTDLLTRAAKGDPAAAGGARRVQVEAALGLPGFVARLLFLPGGRRELVEAEIPLPARVEQAKMVETRTRQAVSPFLTPEADAIANQLQALGWRPALTLDQALGWIVDWHKAVGAGEDARAVTRRQIAAYAALSGAGITRAA